MSCFRDSFKKLSEAQCPHSEVSEAFLCLEELLGVMESEDRKLGGGKWRGREGREVGRDREERGEGLRQRERGADKEKERRDKGERQKEGEWEWVLNDFLNS